MGRFHSHDVGFWMPFPVHLPSNTHLSLSTHTGISSRFHSHREFTHQFPTIPPQWTEQDSMTCRQNHSWPILLSTNSFDASNTTYCRPSDYAIRFIVIALFSSSGTIIYSPYHAPITSRESSLTSLITSLTSFHHIAVQGPSHLTNRARKLSSAFPNHSS
jgi:hypothetical protein